MKIELTEKQLFDIEWSILIAVDSVQQRYLKEKKEIDTPLTKKLWKLHDYIQKERKKNG
jgi:ribonucleotide reductase beta subunit family protein with ferritin-like domain